MDKTSNQTTTAKATVTLHLVVRGAREAAEWYKRTLGAKEVGCIPVPQGKFMQIELQLGNSTLMLADEFAEMGVLGPLAVGGTPVVFHYSTNRAREHFELAVSSGAQVLQPLSEQFWGEFYGQIQDPFGHRWGIAEPVREVPAEEIARTAWKLFGGH